MTNVMFSHTLEDRQTGDSLSVRHRLHCCTQPLPTMDTEYHTTMDKCDNLKSQVIILARLTVLASLLLKLNTPLKDSRYICALSLSPDKCCLLLEMSSRRFYNQMAYLQCFVV